MLNSEFWAECKPPARAGVLDNISTSCCHSAKQLEKALTLKLFLLYFFLSAFRGEKWKTNVLLTALLCPGLVFFPLFLSIDKSEGEGVGEKPIIMILVCVILFMVLPSCCSFLPICEYKGRWILRSWSLVV